MDINIIFLFLGIIGLSINLLALGFYLTRPNPHLPLSFDDRHNYALMIMCGTEFVIFAANAYLWGIPIGALIAISFFFAYVIISVIVNHFTSR